MNSSKLKVGIFNKFIFSPYPGHPGFICKRELILKYLFNVKFKVSADYLLMQQIALDLNNKKYLLKKPISAMELGGKSLKFKGILIGNKNIREINNFLGVTESYLVRYLRNIIQFLLAIFIKYKIKEEFLDEVNEFKN